MSDKSRREFCYTLAVLILLTILTILNARAEKKADGMSILLYILVCFDEACQVVPVPTPITYECGEMPLNVLYDYIAEKYPGYEYRDFRCVYARYAP